ncbi:uncharacterized protein GVI51_K11517 [Nakaseomyces glabratus]|uniref:Autophagy-related protein 31 n=1 Tax=Candida glabrata (strain ATCC 2001 / BCRC 20586 / JCM 3761 / NBRC 0622 / NRRL Y-65 / CBS 138) TaxID=284593 RepID=CIS1_CANGA|nr:uncharacterized protein CAGL0K11682g [Nakaseomyces glabratus]Q6FM20.1 RecName: Full=Autophagy-related protein 31; AltName: Full=Protein CIS1 [Nakaseomyces glabratus CBS 138]KAH7597292.1 Autophagy-related protein 31 [Nakaseomyces glabratus]KAH7603064.1 Autophagy-related protein 31 [Nakaseomyces glabratus]QHS68390.1 uncharacterized protein GVI51_K11517 [Nakaseomyces glabratus]CAG61687.1 unnamed protein product [Nakaseomyces glabratus]|eukprot:XP_448724.1 uncharacterized protein CAGL0K11682g [[Candida] glabrata]
MEPLSLTVYDRNIWHLFKKEEGAPQAMFPTNIKYIFEDDDDVADVDDLVFQQQQPDSELENVIIVEIDGAGQLENVELISDQYEMLSYRRERPVSLASQRSLSWLTSGNDTGGDAGKKSGDISDPAAGPDVPREAPLSIELELVSEFKDYRNLNLEDLKLDELTRIFCIQNKQLQMISDALN